MTVVGTEVADGSSAVSDSGGGSSRAPGRPHQEVVFPTRDQYTGVVGGYRDGGFEMCADLCAVDYLSYPGRRLLSPSPTPARWARC